MIDKQEIEELNKDIIQLGKDKIENLKKNLEEK